MYRHPADTLQIEPYVLMYRHTADRALRIMYRHRTDTLQIEPYVSMYRRRTYNVQKSPTYNVQTFRRIEL